jgi:hypothetical protein
MIVLAWRRPERVVTVWVTVVLAVTVVVFEELVPKIAAIKMMATETVPSVVSTECLCGQFCRAPGVSVMRAKPSAARHRAVDVPPLHADVVRGSAAASSSRTLRRRTARGSLHFQRWASRSCVGPRPAKSGPMTTTCAIRHAHRPPDPVEGVRRVLYALRPLARPPVAMRARPTTGRGRRAAILLICVSSRRAASCNRGRSGCCWRR